jgi:hypothetical protein
MDGMCNKHEGGEKCIQNFCRKTLRERGRLEALCHKWEENIKWE